MPITAPLQAPNAQLASVTNRYYGPALTAALTTFTVSTNTLYFCPIYLSAPTIFKGIGMFATAGAVGAHVGVYVDANGVPGALVAGSDVTITTNAAAKTDATFASPITLGPGWYWLAIVVNGAATFTAIPSTNVNTLGTGDMLASATGANARLSASFTYAALPVTLRPRL